MIVQREYRTFQSYAAFAASVAQMRKKPFSKDPEIAKIEKLKRAKIEATLREDRRLNGKYKAGDIIVRNTEITFTKSGGQWKATKLVDAGFELPPGWQD
jgi:hypothetical protein